MRAETSLVALVLLAAMSVAGQVPRAQSPLPVGFRITNTYVVDGGRVRSTTDVAVESGIIQAVGGDLP